MAEETTELIITNNNAIVVKLRFMVFVVFNCYRLGRLACIFFGPSAKIARHFSSVLVPSASRFFRPTPPTAFIARQFTSRASSDGASAKTFPRLGLRSPLKADPSSDDNVLLTLRGGFLKEINATLCKAPCDTPPPSFGLGPERCNLFVKVLRTK